ncbi:MAG: Uncharacterized protein XD76_1329 [candidate division TA06 bacterium 32_111]|uniref:Outer membrane protein beta-barrel domain-containing protein n=2 Tax=Bacteria candidate phyla TaxID=1783234 RepID=A0A101I2C0_UNCT6|nr:MAG: Uncharacterized protein XD76_1329 [candidate division TA06 bacterium 32_111]KUK86953.1 MAG: Uncharacterized protein XE03_1171 [candidate division TA06 bacterium 34_109]HAF07725.1 hypothetical protein [candidate division WOR-3 bacterium]HCP16096.1 hypothetical protein [candidate division WOR-3 bacterium]
MKKIFILLLSSILFISTFALENFFTLNESEGSVKFYPLYEKGFLNIFSHKIQFGKDCTYFDYVKYGNQNNLYPFERFSIDMVIKNKHIVTFLYQPLTLKTEAYLFDTLVVDSVIFPEGSNMEFFYSFDFYRVSYMYNILTFKRNKVFFGLSFQLRNAFISFSDGENILTNSNIGPVPIFKLKTESEIGSKLSFENEFDGFYASGKYITGSKNDFVGAIFDLSSRFVYNLNSFSNLFLNLRYLGGGAEGTSKDETSRYDGYVKNWLHTFSVSFGIKLK